MANQRPIRRPRVPAWKRGKRRPIRWNAASTGYTPEVGSGLNIVDVYGVGAVPLVSPSFILVDGQVDVEPWADEQEVTLDKTIGRLTFWATYSSIGATIHPPYLKVGIILLEEITQGVDLPEYNLFEQETWEDYEWMWMWAGSMELVGHDAGAETGYARKDLDVYTKNRRKIGQSDQLVVFAQQADGPGVAALATVKAACDIRTVLMSR